MVRFIRWAFVGILAVLLAAQTIQPALAVDYVHWDLTTSNYGGVVPGPAGTATYGFGSFGAGGLESSSTPAGAGGTYYFASAEWPLTGVITCATAVEFHSSHFINADLGNVSISLDGGAIPGGTIFTTGSSGGGGYFYRWVFNTTQEAPTSFNIYSAISGTTYAIDSIDWTIDDIICGGGGGGGLPGDLTFPLASADLYEDWGNYDLASVIASDASVESDYPDTVYAYSNDPAAKVNAVAAGTVTDVVAYSGVDCGGAFASFSKCTVIVPEAISGDSINYVFALETIGASLVTIEDDTDSTISYTYLVSDVAVQPGDVVVAGCILGKTLQLKTITSLEIAAAFPGLISGTDASLSDSAGISARVHVGLAPDVAINIRSMTLSAGVTTVFATQDGTPVQLLPNLSQEPDLTTCLESSLTNCTVTNSQLRSQPDGTIDGWYGQQTTPLDGGTGVSMTFGGQMSQVVVVSPSESYTFSVLARMAPGSLGTWHIHLKANSQIETKEVTSGNYQLLTWELDPIGVSAVNLAVENNVRDPGWDIFPPQIEVKYICLAPASATITPGACLFGNYNFDGNGQGWLPTGSVIFSNGQAILGDAASITAPSIKLLTNPDSSPHTYHITALVRLYANSSYTGQIGKSVKLQYKYPTAGSYVSLGEIDSVMVEDEGRNVYDGSVNIEHVYTLEGDLTISSDTNSNFEFNVVVTDGDSYLKGLRIDSLCATPSTDDGSYPGQGGGGFDPPVIPRCGVVPIPIDNNVSSWTFYHWKNLERFFDCTLMIKINQIAQTVYDAWRTTRLFLRWVIVASNRAGDWLTTAFWWLNGSVRNIAVGQVTTIYEGSGQCSDIFCVFSSLINGVISPIVNTITSILGQAANLLFNTLSVLLSLIVGILNELFGIIRIAQGILASLLSAYNSSTPATIPGLPTCGVDPKSSPFCMAIWILDNTIFSGTGAAIIPALVALFSIHLLIWVVAEVRSTILTIGQTA